jgi:zinc protease
MRILIALPLLALTMPAAGQASAVPGVQSQPPAKTAAPTPAPAKSGASSAPASASASVRGKRAVPAPAPAVSTAVARKIAVRTFAMFNGMKVTLIHAGAEKRAVVDLELGTGEIDEPAFGPGLARLTADILLEGTVARSAAQIKSEAASFGSAVTTQVGPVSTSLRGDVPTQHIARFISLISDVVRHPLLDTAGFERVRRKTIRTLDSTLKNAGDRARQQWRSMVFPDHPFGRPYTYAATLAALQLGHVRNVYDNNFGASRAHLYVSGVFDDNSVEHAVRDAFADWKAGTPAEPRPSAPVAQRQFMLVDWPGAAQSTIWIGLPVIDPSSADFAKLEVANALLSNALGSSNAMNFLDEENATGSNGAAIWRRKGASYWTDVAQVNADSTGTALDAILAQIDRLRREPPSDSALDRVKQAVVGRFNGLSGSREGLVSELSYASEFGLTDPLLADYVRRVMAVSADDVRQMATAQLDPDHMTITVVGDRITVEPLVARFRASTP